MPENSDDNMKPVIMILEDEANIAALLKEALLDEGYEILTAGTAEEFRRIIGVNKIDLFLMDVNLPDASGLTLVKELRRVSDVGIILLTGRTDEMDKVIGLEIGADDYIGKPVHLRELRARVNAVYRRTQSSRLNLRSEEVHKEEAVPAAKTIAFGQWRLHPESRRLTDGENREIRLTTSEFDLLSALVRNRNRVLSRDQIMNAVKGQDWASYDRVVDGIISRLRGKLPVADGAEHFIKTVRGIGYMFAFD
jgi:two-component system torCAD operon response regulator TorR